MKKPECIRHHVQSQAALNVHFNETDAAARCFLKPLLAINLGRDRSGTLGCACRMIIMDFFGQLQGHAGFGPCYASG
jgi:hypothetical protein